MISDEALQAMRDGTADFVMWPRDYYKMYPDQRPTSMFNIIRFKPQGRNKRDMLHFHRFL
jgi:hypothetical protein